MALVDYRAIQDRFTHVDGRITHVAAQRTNAGALSATVAVRLYPWWEHPLFLEARKEGEPWGFDWPEEAERELLVEAINPVRVDVRDSTSAVDLAFFTQHPDLWEFEDEAEIFCNSDVDRIALLRSLAEQAELAAWQGEIRRYISPISSYSAPFSLGYFPRTVFMHVRAALTRLGVRLFITREPEAQDQLVLFKADESIAIIAQDFRVHVPEFEHRPEWFKPR